MPLATVQWEVPTCEASSRSLLKRRWTCRPFFHHPLYLAFVGRPPHGITRPHVAGPNLNHKHHSAACYAPSPGHLRLDHSMREITNPFACCEFLSISTKWILTEMSLSQQSCTFKIWVSKVTKGLNKLFKELKEAQHAWNVAFERAGGECRQRKAAGGGQRWGHPWPCGRFKDLSFHPKSTGGNQGHPALQ